MCRKFSKAIKTASLAVAATLTLTANPAAAGSADQVYSANSHLPVRSEGHRYASNPYGEAAAIQSVAQQVKSNGTRQRISSRGMHIPNKSANRIISRYEYTFPAACGGQTFSYYEGNDFSALGLHNNGKVVFDLLEGGSPYSAPRLWGPYDQVINDPSPMHVVYSEGDESGFGLVKASFMVGKVAEMSMSKQASYGKNYSAGVHSAGSCVSSSNNLLVKK